MTKITTPFDAMQAFIKINNDGLPELFDSLTNVLSRLGTNDMSFLELGDVGAKIHAKLQDLPFEAKVNLDLQFGIQSPEYSMNEFPGQLSNMGGTITLVTDSAGKPQVGASVSEMCEFDVVDDIERVFDALYWRKQKQRFEVGNLISFHPIPAQAEGQPCALSHDHCLVLMCHRDPKRAWVSNGTRGVAVLLDRHGMEKAATYVDTQIDELHKLSASELKEYRVETMEETYETIRELFREMAHAGTTAVEDDLLNLKAWSPAGKPT